MPLLLDNTIRVFTAGINGNVNELCKLMVVSNKSTKDLMIQDKSSRSSILARICTKNRTKAFRFLRSIMDKDQFMEYLFHQNYADQRPYEYAVRYSAVMIVRVIFDMKEMVDKMTSNDDHLYRLLYNLFV